MAEAKTEKAKKEKRKRWYPILAPKLFNEELLGESLIYDANSLLDRIVNTNLMNITNEVKHQNMNVRFRINKVEDNKAFTELISYEMLPSSIKRLLRRDVDRIDESFICETKDNALVKVKPILITKVSTKGSKLKMLRKLLISTIANEIKRESLNEFIHSVLSRKLQNTVKANLQKIYPLRVCEIRYFQLAKSGKPIPVKAPQIKEEEKPKASEDLKEDKEKNPLNEQKVETETSSEKAEE